MRPVRPIAITALAAVFGVAIVLWARPAAAQSCGGQRSTCRACHEERGEHAVNADGTPWHFDHAFGDFCAACHGGDATATGREAAHAGRVPPLAIERCTGCHDDPAPMVAHYADERARRALVSSPVPSTVPSAGGSPSAAAITAPPGWPNAIAIVLVLVIGIGGGLAITRAERRRRGRPTLPVLRSVIASVRALEWSPTWAGVGLGVVITASLAFGHRLSGAAVYQELGSTLGGWLSPGSIYWHHIVGPLRMTWELWAWLGVVLGAFASAQASRTFQLRTMPDRGWVELHGPSIARRWLIAFVGSGLTAFAAGIAGGCTASLAMSGGAVLVPGAFAFMAGMFAGGIPAAQLVGRHHRGAP